MYIKYIRRGFEPRRDVCSYSRISDAQGLGRRACGAKSEDPRRSVPLGEGVRSGSRGTWVEVG